MSGKRKEKSEMTDTHEIVERAEIVPKESVLHPAVEKLLEQNPTPETLEKILQLQREWQQDQAKRAYTKALVALKADLPAWIKRDQVVDFSTSRGNVRYTHASLAEAMEAVTPAVTKHGFSLSWETENKSGESVVKVTAILTHRDGHSEDTSLEAPPDTSGTKNAAQSVASTVTILQRYTALALLGVATKDMKELAPKQESPEDAAGTDRKMRALAFIKSKGKTQEEAEEVVKRSFENWTLEDLSTLREWIKK